jgi:SAM-dependent methyltransferase
VVLNDRASTRHDEERRYTEPGRSSDGGDANRAEARWQTTLRFARRMETGTPRSILDIGCGMGAFLALARRSGARVAGVEIDPRAVSACRAEGLDVIESSIADLLPPAGPWDLVTFWDVLDHLDDPAGALLRVVPVLAPRGMVLIRGRNGSVHVPIKRLCLRVRRLMPAFPDPAVVHRFGISALGYRRMLQNAGFRDIHLSPPGPIPAVLPTVLAAGRISAASLPLEVVSRPVAGTS